VKLTVPIVLEVKLKSEGNVTIIVSVLSAAPVGDVNFIAWLDTALTVRSDMVSEALVIAAADANLNGTE
jgi:hypothetical protein